MPTAVLGHRPRRGRPRLSLLIKGLQRRLALRSLGLVVNVSHAQRRVGKAEALAKLVKGCRVVWPKGPLPRVR